MLIDILMATYNAANFLEEQLDSLLNQTYRDWHLIIRDDVSTDNTVEIIKKYIEKYPNKISLFNADINLGAMANFNELLKLSTAKYVMFADHDDVWLDDKISITFEKMIALEKTSAIGAPILVFTDKSIADANLNITHKSSVRAEKFDVKRLTPQRLLVQNVASGCTIMINKPLLTLCGSIPKEALMHDHYIMLLAAFFGKIGYVDKPAMLYRQHSRNEIGAKSVGLAYFMKKLTESPAAIKSRFMKNIDQADALLKKYSKELSEENRQILENFIRLRTANRPEFIRIIVQNGFYKSGFVRKLGMVALLF